MTVSPQDRRPDDRGVLATQLGREPRGNWRVEVRCSHGRPSVILTEPELEDGSPFPTLYWLTCPWLRRYVDGLESAGAIDIWAARLRADEHLAQAMLAADAEYRRRRAASARDHDPVNGVGIAGQGDPLATKCLHAHVANALARLPDPIGCQILTDIGHVACPDDVCSAHPGQVAM